MNDFEPDTRKLIAQAVLGLSPSVAARQRVRAQLMHVLVNGAETSFSDTDGSASDGSASDGSASDGSASDGSASDGSASSPAVRGARDPRHAHEALARLSKLKPASLLTLGLIVGGVGGYWLGHTQAVPPVETAATPQPLPSRATSVEPTTLAPATSSLDPGLNYNPRDAEPVASNPSPATLKEAAAMPARLRHKATSEPDAGRRNARSRETPKTSELPHSEADEIASVQRGQRALSCEEPRLALGLLRELDLEIPGGRLAEERAAGRAIARCMLLPEAGPRERRAFTQRYSRHCLVPFGRGDLVGH